MQISGAKNKKRVTITGVHTDTWIYTVIILFSTSEIWVYDIIWVWEILNCSSFFPSFCFNFCETKTKHGSILYIQLSSQRGGVKLYVQAYREKLIFNSIKYVFFFFLTPQCIDSKDVLFQECHEVFKISYVEVVGFTLIFKNNGFEPFIPRPKISGINGYC